MAPYSGTNDHTLHAHFSVKSQPEYYDDKHLWAIDMEGAPVTAQKDDETILPVLQRGDKGPWVKVLQRQLIAEGVHVIRIDGDFGRRPKCRCGRFSIATAWWSMACADRTPGKH